MSSNTDNFLNYRESAEINNSHLRNSLSCIKRKPYVSRKLPISPLDINKIMKELEEPEDISPEPEPLEEKSPVKNIAVNERLESVDDSFDLDFSALSVQTPLKKESTKCDFIVTNSISNQKQIQPPDKNVNHLDHIEFKTPVIAGRGPRVQYSALRGNTPLIVNNKGISPDKKNAYLDNHFRTPSVNEVKPTKIQFTTPLNIHSGNAKDVNGRSSSAKVKSRVIPLIKVSSFTDILESDKENNDIENHVQYKIHSPIKEDIFKCITVNSIQFIILSKLGQGGSSEVFQCYNVENKTRRAIKVVSLENSQTATGYINEVKVLQRLQNCEKIIKMFDFEILESEKKLLMVLEIGGADLSKVLKELECNVQHIPWYLLMFYWMEMLHAVKQIHQNGIIHSDLKPANFIIAECGLKLIDFGIASCVQTDMTSVFKTNPEGSCNYISPEALNNDTSTNNHSPNYGKAKYKVSFKSDVWSLGCILYQLIYKRTPFHHIKQMWPKLSTILDPNHKIDYPEAPWISPKLLNTVKSCLQYNAKSRPSVDDLINENYFLNG